ncbi:MAG: phosphopantetheine adenylyltransferase [Halobacteria archaeon]
MAGTQKRIAVGGTFDPLHRGHEALFRRAFALAGPGGEVHVGLTSDRLAGLKARPIRPYGLRRRDVEDFLRGRFHGRKFRVRKLLHPWGAAAREPYDALVVSPETAPAAEALNRGRRERGLMPVRVVTVPHVLAQDGKVLSSTRIARGEVDRRGRVLLSAPRFARAGARNPALRSRASRARSGRVPRELP